ncbi:hypothetical protein E1B28_011891 [Marasmius oreades]|uniref:C2H2-type domain-containing protein n=1 Tax=Marasmius oreades TaxID=181124 RepID=A0A9P7RV07_9AGAR|nr:uncharacterized protein E1B28_011891 [Marasmius oreades]KAG7090294.1 hypothetical protein E1B28_011891 [Marasmius oreades]
MPRVKSEKRSEPRGSSQCTICNVIISNKTDMPRHMKIHSENRDKLMHRCPYPDCKFENLQKSNVETHIRTHTKAKTERCPDCDFSTVDPGSLTRHRKRIHGYIPKTRRSRQPAPPKPPQILPIAGPSSTTTSNNKNKPPYIESIPPHTSFRPSHPESSSSTSHSGSGRQQQEIYREHQLPKYNPQPPHHVQLPPIRFIPQPRTALAPCYSRRQSFAISRSPSVESDSGSSSSSVSFSASAPSASRSPSIPSILTMLPPPVPVHPELSSTLRPVEGW